ncbi:MAG: hypothetical protein HQK50_03695 [Oligoflexia bacterium]|nr:hypothetical protein [Oligoflexia bacterium]MBF0364647.1 hypothetical protein [Oligoflexia bacterium]
MENFYKFIIENKVARISKTPFTLASGRTSNFYVNWRKVAEDVYLFSQLLQFVLQFIKDQQITADTFYGVPEGGSKLGLFVQFFTAQEKSAASGNAVLAMGRGKHKEHGDVSDRYFLGVPKGKIIVIEDVATTGESLIKTIHQLQELKCGIVQAVLVLTDREEKRNDGLTVREYIEERLHLNYYALSSGNKIKELLHDE